MRTPCQGHRCRRGHSPRAGGSPRRLPRAARRWRPCPWPRSARAPVPGTAAPPARTHPLGARLPAPCHVGAWSRPPLTMTPLESGLLPRFQGRALLQLQAARGATGTLTRESPSARHHQTRTRSRGCPEMSSNDSSLMVRGPGTAQPLPPGLSALGPVTPAPCSSPVTSLTARAASATRLSLSPAASGCLRPFSPHSPWQAHPLWCSLSPRSSSPPSPIPELPKPKHKNPSPSPSHYLPFPCLCLFNSVDRTTI